MIEDFIDAYVKKIVKYPESIKVQNTSLEPGIKEIKIIAHSNDVGRLIGKDGKMIGALKALISGAKAKDGLIYKIIVEAKS